MLKDVFGFAEHQEKATSGLGYKLTLTRNFDNSVLNKANATIIGEIKLIVLSGMCRIIHTVFHNKLYYMNRF